MLLHSSVPPATATFRLRTYGPEDFESLYRIDQLCYEPEIAYSRRELRAYLKYPGADCVVAEAETGNASDPMTLIGFCVTSLEGGQGYIITMDVVEAWRRRQVGTALLTETENRMAARGAVQVALDTATDNASAIAFWQRHGYRTRGVRKRYYPNGRDAYAMLKILE